MNSEPELATIYQTRLTPLLESLEVTRKQVVRSFWNAMLWLLLLIPVVYIAVSLGNPWFLLLGAAPVTVSVIRFISYGKSKRDYTLGFKKTVIKELVKLKDPDLIYAPQSGITMDEYCESDIFHERIDSYNTDDLVTGFLGVTSIKFSELHHQEKRETRDSKGNRQTTWVTIFKGIFFIGDFNKNFIGCTYVFPDSGSSFLGLGKLFEKWSGGRGDLVKLENPDFEKLFTVYGTDQVEARYILSPSLMERLIKFRMKTNVPLRVSFVNSKVFIAIPVKKDLFEPNVFSSGKKFDYLNEYFYYLDLATDIVSDLNLNLRIWGKT